MSDKKTFIVVEKSFIIRKGLTVMLNQLPMVKKIVELEEDALIQKNLSMYHPDVLIINPQAVGSLQRKSIRDMFSLSQKVRIIAFVYSYVDEQALNQYDAVIRVDDTMEKIEDTLKKLSKTNEEEPEDESRELSDREKDILIGVVKGMINKEIAEHHNISINTVITHRRNIARKLDIHSPAGLTVYAILNKLVNIDELS